MCSLVLLLNLSQKQNGKTLTKVRESIRSIKTLKNILIVLN